MFRRRHQATVIAQGLRIAGNVSAEGSVELHGEIDGELHCTSLRVSEKGRINGKIIAEDVTVNGTVEGPIHGEHVSLEPRARVTGDVHHDSFSIEKGAFFDGRSRQKDAQAKEKSAKAAKKESARLQNGADRKGDGADTEDQDTAPVAA